MTDHTPEPWRVRGLVPSYDGYDSNSIYGSGEYDIITPKRVCGIEKADAERAVACVNACKGMKNPEEEIALMRNHLHLANSYIISADKKNQKDASDD